MTGKKILLILISFLEIYFSFGQEMQNNRIQNLNSSTPLFSQFISPGETLLYPLQNLRPQKLYEIRISWPSIYPTEWKITLTENASQQGLPSKFSRNLLNSEKIIFRTDEEGKVLGFKAPAVRLEAIFSSFTSRKDILERRIPFNLQMD
eukprot:Sdes_comp11175_c0_seq1m2713